MDRIYRIVCRRPASPEKSASRAAASHPVYPELFAKFATGQVILPANVMFCLFQYRVRPGEKCGFTTKSTKVTKRILDFVPLFLCFCAFCGHSRQKSRCRILQTPLLFIHFPDLHRWTGWTGLFVADRLLPKADLDGLLRLSSSFSFCLSCSSCLSMFPIWSFSYDPPRRGGGGAAVSAIRLPGSPGPVPPGWSGRTGPFRTHPPAAFSFPGPAHSGR